MGQATVDLPDPLEKPKPALTSSADDLLAQLAGDEIDRLLAESDNGKSPQPSPPPPVVIDSAPHAAAPIEEIAPPIEPPPVIEEPATDLPETETGSVERSALAASELAQQSTVLPDLDSDLPFFLKPLVWLNAPLDSCPEEWRETVGKIALLTLVNAIAVLAYVVIFRRHH